MNYSSIIVTSNALDQTVPPHHLPFFFDLNLLLLHLAFQSQVSTLAARETSEVEDTQGGSNTPTHCSLVTSLPQQWLP